MYESLQYSAGTETQRIFTGRTKLPDRQSLDRHYPYPDAIHRRRGVGEISFGIVLHDQVQRAYFFVVFLFKRHLPVA